MVVDGQPWVDQSFEMVENLVHSHQDLRRDTDSYPSFHSLRINQPRYGPPGPPRKGPPFLPRPPRIPRGVLYCLRSAAYFEPCTLLPLGPVTLAASRPFSPRIQTDGDQMDAFSLNYLPFTISNSTFSSSPTLRKYF